MKEPVRIREKKISGGNISLYLDIYQNGLRKKETLKLYLVPEINAATKLQNANTRKLAEQIKAQRILDIQREGLVDWDKVKKSRMTLTKWMDDFVKYNAELSESSMKTKRNTHARIDQYLLFIGKPEFLLKDVDKEFCKGFEEHISGARKNEERPVLCEAIAYCKENRIGILLVSELSRLGRNAFEVLASVKELIDSGINLYIQKEQLTLLNDEGHPSLFAPIMIATLSTCAQLERDNISFRLQSGRKRYIEKGGKLGRKVGSVKTAEQMKAEYREVICLLRKGYSIRDVAKLSGKGLSTVQRVKKLFA